jgi:hypothetical protein
VESGVINEELEGGRGVIDKVGWARSLGVEELQFNLFWVIFQKWDYTVQLNFRLIVTLVCVLHMYGKFLVYSSFYLYVEGAEFQVFAPCSYICVPYSGCVEQI